MKWRLEYKHDGDRRLYRVLDDSVEFESECLSLAEAHRLLGPGHPVMEDVEAIFRHSRDVVRVEPWVPFEPDSDLVKAHGDLVAKTIEDWNQEALVVGGKDGWRWVHLPGDRSI